MANKTVRVWEFHAHQNFLVPKANLPSLRQTLPFRGSLSLTWKYPRRNPLPLTKFCPNRCRLAPRQSLRIHGKISVYLKHPFFFHLLYVGPLRGGEDGYLMALRRPIYARRVGGSIKTGVIYSECARENLQARYKLREEKKRRGDRCIILPKSYGRGRLFRMALAVKCRQ